MQDVNNGAALAAGAMGASTPTMLRERVDAVWRRLPPAFDGDGAHQLTTKDVLKAFAKEGLLDLDFLDPNASSVPPSDLRRAATTIGLLAERSGTLASIFMVNGLLASAVITMEGTREQKQQLLPRLRAGNLELAFALTEPEAGSDAAGILTTASASGNGVALKGQKIYTTGAASADWIVVVARDAAQAANKRAVGLFLVPKGTPGVTVEPLEKLSANLHPSCRVTLDDVQLGLDQVVGGHARIGAAWNTLRATGTMERLIVAAVAHGLARSVVNRALEFAKSRRQFGQAITAFQAIQHALVEMQTLEKAMQLFVENAISALEQGSDATQEVCMAKYFCAEQLQAIVGLGMRVMGGRGYFGFEDMSRYYREAPFSLYAGGTVEIQKMLIARTMGIG